MADITLTYKGSTIGEVSDSGSHTIDTEGMFCEADIGLTYVKPSGGGDHWTRPSDWPNLDTVVTTGFEGIYLTYDLTKAPAPEQRYISVYAQGKNYKQSTVQRGHLDANREFVVDYTATTSSYKFSEQLDPLNGDVQLWRVLNTETNGLENFHFESISGINNTQRYQPCVEVLLVYGTQTFKPGDNYPYTVESIRIIGTLNSISAYQSFYQAYGLRRLDASGASGTISDFRQGVSNCVKMTECDFGDIGGSPSWNGTFNNWYSMKSFVCPAFTFSGQLSYFIGECWNLEELDINSINVSGVTGLAASFLQNDVNLKTLYMDELDFTGITSGSVSINLPSLINLYPPVFYVSQTWNCPSLSTESLLRLIDALPETQSTLTLTIGALNISKLTAAQIAVATGKGWTVA